MPTDVPPAIETDVPSDGMNYAFEGVALTGSPDDLRRAQKAAETSGWGVERSALGNGQELLILRLPAEVSRSEYTEYMHRVTRGEFGDIKLGLVAAPRSSSAE